MYGHEDLPWLRGGASKLGATTIACVVAALVLAPGLASAKDVANNLGGGLEELVAPSGLAKAAPMQAKSALKAAATAEPVLEVTHPIQFDASGRALVRISLDGKTPAVTVIQALKKMPSVEVTASDLNYSAGIVEAWVPTTSLKALATSRGVRAVVPSSPWKTNVGATTSQGVIQHRVDKLPPGINGDGITVGVMSDSYDTDRTPDSAALDVSTGDLPGAGNPNGNTKPVVVLQDNPNGTDEGRAMLQIVHDMAPKARLGFATAEGGELNFADNIRSLAGLPSGTKAVPGFKADIIVDDIIYFAEPFFQDGVVAQAVDEVAAKGISYFSSAGNRPASGSYDAKPNIVPPVPASLAGTNLDFSAVPPELYAGGFHNFAPNGKLDIAQTISFADDTTIVFQWNEPYDPKPPTPVGAPLASGKGTVPLGGTDEFTFTGTAGKLVQIFADTDNSNGNGHPDLTLDIFDPDGNEIAFVDNTTVPESAILTLPADGTYTVVVGSFEADQSGDYVYNVQQVEIVQQVLTDYNLLFFTTTGRFIGALAEQNLFTGRPVELGGLPNATLQMVIARANVPDPKNKNVADRIRYVGFGTMQPQEYYSYMDPVTYGHNSARGAMGVAAYPFFPPFVPEAFTSPGPSTIYFDTNDKRLKTPEIRQKPDIAAMDGANTTFFVSDSSTDPDTFPNFFGTSAAAPHAASIAALVLQAAGGSGKVKPNEMRRILQTSVFAHDLDPFFSWGVGLGLGSLVTVNASADPNGISQFDPNVFTVSQFGLRKLQSFSINGSTADVTQTPKGIVFDTRSTPTPAPGQPFVVGQTVGLTAADVTASFSQPADPPGVAGQWKQLDLLFAPGSFRSGDLLSFGVDRDEADGAGPVTGAAGGNSADLLGGGVLIPSGQFVNGGAKFSGKFEGGGSFSGQMNNLIGYGWSPLDGYGFINAEAAVKQVLKKH
jgi:subtilase family protein